MGDATRHDELTSYLDREEARAQRLFDMRDTCDGRREQEFERAANDILTVVRNVRAIFRSAPPAVPRDDTEGATPGWRERLAAVASLGEFPDMYDGPIARVYEDAPDEVTFASDLRTALASLSVATAQADREAAVAVLVEWAQSLAPLDQRDFHDDTWPASEVRERVLPRLLAALTGTS